MCLANERRGVQVQLAVGKRRIKKQTILAGCI
jgi:hypothetical protein